MEGKSCDLESSGRRNRSEGCCSIWSWSYWRSLGSVWWEKEGREPELQVILKKFTNCRQQNRIVWLRATWIGGHWGLETKSRLWLLLEIRGEKKEDREGYIEFRYEMRGLEMGSTLPVMLLGDLIKVKIAWRGILKSEGLREISTVEFRFLHGKAWKDECWWRRTWVGLGWLEWRWEVRLDDGVKISTWDARVPFDRARERAWWAHEWEGAAVGVLDGRRTKERRAILRRLNEERVSGKRQGDEAFGWTGNREPPEPVWWKFTVAARL